jgi:hypothetical protein
MIRILVQKRVYPILSAQVKLYKKIHDMEVTVLLQICVFILIFTTGEYRKNYFLHIPNVVAVGVGLVICQNCFNSMFPASTGILTIVKY